MKSTIKISTILVSLAFLAPATVMAETIDFSTLTNGTAVTSQFNGVTFSLQGGTSNGAPITSSGLGLTDSTTGNYPTAYYLVANFSSAASGISFQFNPLGTNSLANQKIFLYSGSNLIGTINYSSGSTATYNLSSYSGITSILWGNGDTTTWNQALVSLTFNSLNVTSSATAQHNSPALGAARIIDANSNLQGLFSGANLSGNQQVSNAASSTLPLLTGGTTHAVQSGLTSFNNIIDARQGYNRGASSGDDFQGNHDVWVKAFGTLTNQADTQGVNGYKVKTSGVVLGLDKTVNSKLNLGAAFAYADSNVTSDISGGGTQNMNVKSYQLIGYGSYALNPTDTFNFQVDGGQNNNSGSRHITFLNEVANSSYDSWSAHLGASLSRNYVLNERATMTPSMRVDYTRISESGYSENGAGLLDLNVARNDTEALVLGLDDKLAYKLNDHITLSANLGLGYNAMNKQNSINSAFAGDPTASFVTTGINDGAWLGRGGLGLSYKANNGLEITGRYDVDFHSSYLSQTASVKLNMPF